MTRQTSSRNCPELFQRSHRAMLGLTLLFVLLALSPIAHSADDANCERLLALFQSGKLDELRDASANLPEASAEGQFFRGLFEPDGNKARYHYDQVIALYPGSPCRPWALQRLWQHHWALGEREMAERFYGLLVKRHPDHPAAKPAPQFKFAGDLFELKKESMIAKNTKPMQQIGGEHWTIQLGAFRNAESAKNIGAEASRWGEVQYVKKTVNGDKLTVVQLGAFASRGEAEEFYKRIKKSSTLNGRVLLVNNN